MSYLVAIDIGNTTVTITILKKDRVVYLRQVETSLGNVSLKRKLKDVLSQVLKKYSAVDRAIVCSVVPRALSFVKPILRELRLPTSVIGKDIKVPIKNLYGNPKQVGQDRLVCAYAAMEIYGCPLIVIDFGTAITFDVVSKKREYLGGIILPGIRLTAESLFKKTALLPKVKIKVAKELIGRDTEQSILSGIFYGYGALCSGVIQLISKNIRSNPKVILTGGYCDLMKKFISGEKFHVDKDLVFKGIFLTFQNSYPPKNQF